MRVTWGNNNNNNSNNNNNRNNNNNMNNKWAQQGGVFVGISSIIAGTDAANCKRKLAANKSWGANGQQLPGEEGGGGRRSGTDEEVNAKFRVDQLN